MVSCLMRDSGRPRFVEAARGCLALCKGLAGVEASGIAHHTYSSLASTKYETVAETHQVQQDIKSIEEFGDPIGSPGNYRQTTFHQKWS